MFCYRAFIFIKIQRQKILIIINIKARNEHLILKINHKDNVLVALQDIPAETQIIFEGINYTTLEAIPAKHRFFIPTVFCENRNLDIIKESLCDNLGYTVDAKYKDYTYQLVEAIAKGENIDDLNFSHSNIPVKDRILKM